LGVAGSQPEKDVYTAVLSSDGRTVAFVSNSDNLVPGDTNGTFDVFARDLRTGTTTRVSVSSGGRQSLRASDAPTVSGDGRYVAFQTDGREFDPRDINDKKDVYVHDRQTRRTRWVSARPNGRNGNGESLWPALDPSGRWMSFTSRASNLIGSETEPRRPNVFLRDLRTWKLIKVSIGIGGAHASGFSEVSKVGGEGRVVAFHSRATNLVSNDSNGPRCDVFARVGLR
jgi:hypothetical protein